MTTLLQLLQQIESLDCDREMKLRYARHVVSGYVNEHPEENVADIVVAIYFRETRELPLECRDLAILDLVRPIK